MSTTKTLEAAAIPSNAVDVTLHINGEMHLLADLDARANPRVDERQPVPLRRLSQHCRCDLGSAVGGPAMNPFAYARTALMDEAIESVAEEHEAVFFAGGTTLLDLMKLEVLAPARI